MSLPVVRKVLLAVVTISIGLASSIAVAQHRGGGGHSGGGHGGAGHSGGGHGGGSHMGGGYGHSSSGFHGYSGHGYSGSYGSNYGSFRPSISLSIGGGYPYGLGYSGLGYGGLGYSSLSYYGAGYGGLGYSSARIGSYGYSVINPYASSYYYQPPVNYQSTIYLYQPSANPAGGAGYQAAYGDYSAQATPGSSNNAGPAVVPSTPDLQPGMVLPDGSTVISVGTVSGNGISL